MSAIPLNDETDLDDIVFVTYRFGDMGVNKGKSVATLVHDGLSMVTGRRTENPEHAFLASLVHVLVQKGTLDLDDLPYLDWPIPLERIEREEG